MSRIKRGTPQHPTQSKTPEKITYRVIKEFKRIPVSPDNPNNLIIYWLINWCRAIPCFEKRRVYQSKTGLKTYKQCGLTADDISWIIANQDDILKQLKEGG